MKTTDESIENGRAKTNRVLLFALPRDDVQQGVVWLGIDHPQTVVRVGVWLGLIGLLLGNQCAANAFVGELSD